MNEPLIINWYPNLKDAYYGIRLGTWGTPGRTMRSLFLLVVFPGVLFGWFFDSAMGSQLSLPAAITAAIGFALAWAVLFGLAFGAWMARFIVKTQRAKGNPQKIVVTDESVERVLNDSKITYPWTAVSRIEETPLVFLLFGAAGPVTAIEKSGIESDAQLQTLRSFLQAKKPGTYLDGKST